MRMTFGWALIANEDKTNTIASDGNNFIIKQDTPHDAELHEPAQRGQNERSSKLFYKYQSESRKKTL